MKNQTQPEIEKIKELVKEVVKNPDKYPSERKFILLLKIWIGQVDEADYKVLEGNVIEIELEDQPEYPYLTYKTVALIPTKIPTVIIWRKNEEDGYMEKTVYVFTREGWKRVDV